MKLTRHDWLILGILAASTFGVYARTFRFEFVHYDDPEYVFRNECLTEGLSAKNLRYAFTATVLSHWHPLTWLSYMLDAELFGIDAGAFHRTNVLLHVGSTLLLFLALRSATGASWRSGLAAALFALHPLRVESVAWVAERKDVLSTFLGMCALLAYVRYAQRTTPPRYLICLVLFALCLMAKPMLLTLPLVLLLLDYWPLDRFKTCSSIRLIAEKIPMLLMTLGSAAMTLLAAQREILPLQTVPLPVRLANVPISHVEYLKDMIWPAKLAVLYPMATGIPVGLLVLSLALLGVIAAAAILQARDRPQLLVGLLWFLIVLLPVNGIVAIGELSRADRYTYFPMIGIIIAVVWSIPPIKSREGIGAVAVTAVIVLVALSVQTWRQLDHWRNSESLFERALAIIGPHPSLYLNYAIAVSEKQQHARAIELYRRALAFNPRWSKALNNMGNSLLQVERFDEAIDCFRTAIDSDPNYAIAYYNLGTTLGKLGRLAEAEQLLREALRLAPDHQAARRNLNNALMLQGKPME